MGEGLCQEKNRVDMLNVLKFFAFMLIFLYNAKNFVPVNWNENYSKAWMFYTPGHAGVWIFIMLSGYGVGAGFYSGKYKLSVDGVIHFYVRRLISMVPIYWFWVIMVAIFIKPEILMPSLKHFGYLLKLFFFNYQEEFFPDEFGIGWYMTTLMRLYLVAPLGYVILHKLVKSNKQTYCALFFLIVVGLIVRCLMGYHILLTGRGNWGINIYKPYYFNLDIFFSGMLLNQLKKNKKNINSAHKLMGRITSMLLLLFMIMINSRIFYACKFEDANYLNIYYYVFPCVYIILIAIYIYYFELQREFVQSRLSINQLKKNFMRVFDYFPHVQYSLYLFQNTILFCVASAYDETIYMKLCSIFLIPQGKFNFVIGCLYTLIALMITLIWSMIVNKMISEKGVKIWSLFEKKEYSGIGRGVTQILQRMFPA